jgi:hypothetical protein
MATMSREQMLSIITAMDESHLSRALSAAGIDCGDCGSYQDQMGEHADSAEGLVSWNATDVKIPSSKRPALFDKAAHVEQQAQPRRRLELSPQESGMEDWQAPTAAMGL